MATAATFRYSLPYESHFEKLLESAGKSSFDPLTEIDWAAPVNEEKYGLNPEWCSLFGTELWDSLTESQRVTLTRHEATSIMSMGIWFETLLQSMLLRAHYSTSYDSPEYRWVLTEIADECRHSVMFSMSAEKMGISCYRPKRLYHELGRVFRIIAPPEVAYAGILAAEEMLDMMQRDWMRGEDVLDEVRMASKIHIIEEARHLKFARIELRKEVEDMSGLRRHFSAAFTALVATVIFDAMVHPDVYKSVGLDPAEAKKAAWKNPHRREMFLLGNQRLMGFFEDIGFMTPFAKRMYHKVSAI